tara:strand:- start:275 stop:655 length:381 start_codon:yes stop_codon:yes gene_type:complete
MDFKTILAILVIGLISWFNAQEGIKKGRNSLICYLLSSLMVCMILLTGGMWLMSVSWIYHLAKGIDITWWIGVPIYFVLVAITSIASILISIFFSTLHDNYSKKGIIKIGLRLPNFIKKYFKIKKF